MNSEKQHWENVYQSKQSNEVSWTQDVPKTSLDFIRSFHVPKSAKIIDIGGGDSKLVDHLLSEGFEHLTILDISKAALERAKRRLGERADMVEWVVSDITEFQPANTYDVWHDRATFHFLTTPSKISTYLDIARQSVSRYLTIGTFSVDGPGKCSGLDVKQYSEVDLASELANGFAKIRCITEDHITPFNTSQNFLFCSFRRSYSEGFKNLGSV